AFSQPRTHRLDRPAVHLDNALRDGEPEPQSCLGPRSRTGPLREGSEYLANIRSVDAPSGIFDLDDERSGRLTVEQCGITRADGDQASGRSELRRIVEQIPKDLTEAVPIADNEGVGSLEFGDHSQLGAIELMPAN